MDLLGPWTGVVSGEVPGGAHQGHDSLLVHSALTLSFSTDQAQMELFQAKLCSEYMSAGYNNQIKIVLISHV